MKLISEFVENDIEFFITENKKTGGKAKDKYKAITQM